MYFICENGERHSYRPCLEQWVAQTDRLVTYETPSPLRPYNTWWSQVFSVPPAVLHDEFRHVERSTPSKSHTRNLFEMLSSVRNHFSRVRFCESWSLKIGNNFRVCNFFMFVGNAYKRGISHTRNWIVVRTTRFKETRVCDLYAYQLQLIDKCCFAAKL